LLKQLYQCFEESRSELEILLQNIPDYQWILDTLAGSKYIPIGVAFRSRIQGSRKNLPFLNNQYKYKLLRDICKIYAKLLGSHLLQNTVRMYMRRIMTHTMAGMIAFSHHPKINMQGSQLLSSSTTA
jgi:hypothetical protein